MDVVQSLLHLLRDPSWVITTFGYPGMALIIFLETGALVFFLPGDSLLVMAGLFAARGDLNILALNALLIPLAIAGDACSYKIGHTLGDTIFSKKTRLIRPEHLKAAHDFYERHGGRAIVLARFVPVVRTFVPVIAGVARMGYKRFAVFNMLGGFGWIMSMTLVGYVLGTRFPVLVEHIEKVVLAVVVLSVLPIIFEYLRARLSCRARA